MCCHSLYSSDTIPTKEHSSINSTPVESNSGSTLTDIQYSNNNGDHPVTPPPSYSEAIPQAPEASDLSNEDDGLNNKDASSAPTSTWYNEGPSSSNKVDDEPTEEESIAAALKNVSLLYLTNHLYALYSKSLQLATYMYKL